VGKSPRPEIRMEIKYLCVKKILNLSSYVNNLTLGKLVESSNGEQQEWCYKTRIRLKIYMSDSAFGLQITSTSTNAQTSSDKLRSIN